MDPRRKLSGRSAIIAWALLLSYFLLVGVTAVSVSAGGS